jgi:hypothetical protein
MPALLPPIHPKQTTLHLYVIVTSSYFKLLPFFERASHSPPLLLACELVAVALGSLLFPNLVLLFYPVTRGSAVLAAAGFSYPEAIRCGEHEYVCGQTL